jgi:hypothetical protein
MDVKVTLSFDEEVVAKAKKFADDNNISLSRLTEYLYSKITTGHYKGLEDLPIADWVNKVAEGEASYETRANRKKKMKHEFFKSRK